MYEGEALVIIFTVVPFALALYYGYRAGWFWRLTKKK